MLVHRLFRTLILPALGGLTLTPISHAETTYITGTGLDGVTNRNLALDRTPALYTGDFGDCLGGQSLLNVTKFDAAFYYDNSTILFHLDGTTNIRNESSQLTVRSVYISVEAYGESSMCPLNATIPIQAFALFQVGPQQVSGIPQIAYEVPDLEGFARIQIFANSSQTEIGCFQAVMKNGHSFSQPSSISTVLGIFTVVAIIASFATAAYGVSLPHMRSHYAHSLSVLVVFETFQSIFYSGALSLPWPSVLPAWWSNFAWAAGLVPSAGIVNSINPFVGVNGNASQVGGAGSTIINNQGGLRQQIYGRSLASDVVSELYKRRPESRQPYNPNDPYDYNWNGDPVQPGMPLPGDWTGFAGELSEMSIPAPNAFLVALIWLLVYALEGLARLKWIKQDRLDLALLRTLFIAFFSLTTLAMFQFTIHGSAGPTAVAAVVFIIFMVGVGGLVVYALHFRLRFSTFSIMGFIPGVVPIRLSQLKEEESGERPTGSIPFNVHQDEPYVKRWWFFALWLAYQFIRAFFGLFIVDILALVIIAALNPYEGQRNTALAVWLLALTRVATTGLSIAFLPDFNLNRIVVTCLLTIALMILIVLGGISSWMSLSRNREYFASERLEGVRIQYFEHIARRATDQPPPPKPRVEPETGSAEKFPELAKEPYFTVTSVRRTPKIEDEDDDYLAEMNPPPVSSVVSFAPGTTNARPRTASVSSRHPVSSIPRTARVHRASWSSRDFSQFQADQDRPNPTLVRRMSGGLSHTRCSSMKMAGTLRSQASTNTLRLGTPVPSSRPMTPTKEVVEKESTLDQVEETDKEGDKSRLYTEKQYREEKK
ncbi:TRP-domain-containing protein [Hypoxylon sp. FL1150]|nr:TRP-domain-containing protein [Hypoxylon sp. FL1150]